MDIYAEGVAEHDTVIRYRGLDWVVLRGVFAPYPTFSSSRGITHKNIEMYRHKTVLDIGTGTGVRAVLAALSGAASVIATDISWEACVNARINARRQNVALQVVQTNMFEAVCGTFDTVVSYLPSRNEPLQKPGDHTIHDPDFVLNNQLIQEAKDYLVPGGSLHTSFLDQGQIEDMLFEIEWAGLRLKDHTVKPHDTGDWHFVEAVRPT